MLSMLERSGARGPGGGRSPRNRRHARSTRRARPPPGMPRCSRPRPMRRATPPRAGDGSPSRLSPRETRSRPWARPTSASTPTRRARPSRRRGLLPQEVEQPAQRRSPALGHDLDPAVAGVAGVADEPELQRLRPGPPPEPHTLHPTVHPDDRTRRDRGVSICTTLSSVVRPALAPAPRRSATPVRNASRPRRASGVTAASAPGRSRAWPARAGLAAGARERRAVHEVLAPDRRAAPVARPTLLAVGVQRPVEVARGAVDVDVQRVEARAALAERLAHHVAGVVERRRDRARLSERRHSRSPCTCARHRASSA